MLAWVAFLAAAVSLLLRTITPIRLAIVLAMFNTVFWIESGWPKPLAAIPQTLLACCAAFAVITLAQAGDRQLARRFSRSIDRAKSRSL